MGPIYPEPAIAELAERIAASLNRHFGVAYSSIHCLSAHGENISFGERPVWTFLPERLIGEREARDLLLARVLSCPENSVPEEGYRAAAPVALADTEAFDLALFGRPAKDV
jgi:hypothetical protein